MLCTLRAVMLLKESAKLECLHQYAPFLIRILTACKESEYQESKHESGWLSCEIPSGLVMYGSEDPFELPACTSLV